ncbi:hypothetical protein SAMN05216323_10877 [Williamwhitmania taraxaci]|uniref:Uncharacterized protein n=2 Tax=Williamwhitmania taraxaci TaxID=1640674 RepID=A0A1G6S579_9BACT|nr:hypothetical protein SAMN05216323_10877 [Williamwhitmania taraxaci]
MVAANMGAGQMSYIERHLVYPFRTMDKGLYEVGLGVENLLSPAMILLQKIKGGSQNFIQSIGVYAFYRMGPYAFEKQGNNFFFKISAGINL